MHDPDPEKYENAEVQASLVLKLRQQGIGNLQVLSGMERVPRHLFLPAQYRKLAYKEAVLPIECGQSISPPSLVARMIDILSVGENDTVLEVGTGSGYQAGVLACLARRVDSIERYKTLAQLARERIASLKLSNVHVHHGDGLSGLQARAPFTRIILAGAVPTFPDRLLQQLSIGGIILAPLGYPGKPQQLTTLTRGDDGDHRCEWGSVRMTALVSDIAEQL